MRDPFGVWTRNDVDTSVDRATRHTTHDEGRPMVDTRERNARNLPDRDASGNLPASCWPGLYPLFYVDKGNNTLCATCASRAVDPSQDVVGCDVHMEGPPLVCDDCGTAIESAYGKPADKFNVGDRVRVRSTPALVLVAGMTGTVTEGPERQSVGNVYPYAVTLDRPAVNGLTVVVADADELEAITDTRHESLAAIPRQSRVL